MLSVNQETYIQEELKKPKIFRERWDMQIYSKEQLKDILEKNGFEVLKFYGNNGEKLGRLDTLSIFTVARKR